MIEKFDEYGKRYYEITDDEAQALPGGTRLYMLDNLPEGRHAIAPPDCKHDFVISWGVSNNIKGCKKCIYWEFTRLPATENGN